MIALNCSLQFLYICVLFRRAADNRQRPYLRRFELFVLSSLIYAIMKVWQSPDPLSNI